MKRNELVKSLINEGFSEKTLVNFTDKQLSTLHERIVVDADKLKSDPKLQALANDPNTEVEVKEEKPSSEFSKEKKSKVGKKVKKGDETEVTEWVESIAENNYHSFTSKGEIMELIKSKLVEQETSPKVKKGHNGIPEFMSYDEISKTETMEQSPTTKPAPTKPKTSPGTKPKTPYQPGPGKNPKPKALKEEK